MKTCPVCRAVCFDDMEVCYGCLHRFAKDEGQTAPLSCEGVGEGGSRPAMAAVGSVPGGEIGRPPKARAEGAPVSGRKATASSESPREDRSGSEGALPKGAAVASPQGVVLSVPVLAEEWAAVTGCSAGAPCVRIVISFQGGRDCCGEHRTVGTYESS